MSHADDLALVTACRDALESGLSLPQPSWLMPQERWQAITIAALSLIEDTLNRHAATDRYAFDADTGGHCRECTRSSNGHVITADFPCDTYCHAHTALHTIATALGVNN